jgi:hypothetical protein
LHGKSIAIRIFLSKLLKILPEQCGWEWWGYIQYMPYLASWRHRRCSTIRPCRGSRSWFIWTAVGGSLPQREQIKHCIAMYWFNTQHIVLHLWCTACDPGHWTFCFVEGDLTWWLASLFPWCWRCCRVWEVAGSTPGLVTYDSLRGKRSPWELKHRHSIEMYLCEIVLDKQL